MRVVGLALLAGAASCASTVARIDAEDGRGPARLDRNRPIAVEERDDQVVLRFPLWIEPGAGDVVGPCTVRVGRLDFATADRMRGFATLSIQADQAVESLLASPADTVVVLDPNETSRLRVDRVLSSGPETLGIEAEPTTLYVEVESGAAAGPVCQMTGLTDESRMRTYLVSMGEVEGVGGSGVAAFAALWIIVLATSLR